MPSCAGSRRNTRTWGHGHMSSQELRLLLVAITGTITSLHTKPASLESSFCLFVLPILVLSLLKIVNIVCSEMGSCWLLLAHLIIILIFKPTIFFNIQSVMHHQILLHNYTMPIVKDVDQS